MNRIFVAITVSASLLGGCATKTDSSNNDFMSKVSSTATSIGSTVGSAASSLFSGYENGIYVSPEQLSQIKPGKSKSSDVVAIIGHPAKKEQLKNKEVWSYPYTKIPHFGPNTNETTLIEINDRGLVVKAYKAGGRQDSTGNPLVDAANGLN